jgi:hypothetical protein
MRISSFVATSEHGGPDEMTSQSGWVTSILVNPPAESRAQVGQ